MRKISMSTFFNFKIILIYIISFLFILNSNSIFMSIYQNYNLPRFITYSPVFFILLILMFGTHRNKIKKINNALKVVIFFLIYLMIYILLSHSPLVKSFSELITICAILLYFIIYEKDDMPYILKAFSDIIFIISIIALFFWLFGTTFKMIECNGYVLCDWHADVRYKKINCYYFIHYECDTSITNFDGINRNSSIFLEGGFASYNFTIGLLYELFIKDKKSKFRIIVLSLAILTTFSTTAYVILLLTFFVYFLLNGKNNKNARFFRVLTILAFSICVLLILSNILNKKMGTHSGQSRSIDFINGFKAWTLSPLWGYGYGNHGYIISTLGTGYSNSITNILTQGGIMIMLIYLICFIISIVNCYKTKNKNMFGFIIIFLAVLTFEIIAFLNITVYLLAFITIFSKKNSQINLNTNLIIKNKGNILNNGLVGKVIKWNRY